MAEGGDAGWWQRQNQRAEGPIGKVFGWVIAPALAASFLVIAVQDIGPAWDAARGRGIHGTMTVTERDCSGRGGCSAYGPFVSDDGSTKVLRVMMDIPPRGWRVGHRVRAIYHEGREPPVVYRERGSYDWAIIVGFFAAAVVVLGVWLGFVLQVLGNWWRRRGERTG